MKFLPGAVASKTLVRIGAREQRNDDVLKIIRAGREHGGQAHVAGRLLLDGAEGAKTVADVCPDTRPNSWSTESREIRGEYCVKGKCRIDQKCPDHCGGSVAGGRLVPQVGRDYTQWL